VLEIEPPTAAPVADVVPVIVAPPDGVGALVSVEEIVWVIDWVNEKDCDGIEEGVGVLVEVKDTPLEVFCAFT